MGVKVLEKHPEHFIRVLRGQRPVGFFAGLFKILLPAVGFSGVVRFPEGLKHVTVIQKRSDGAGKFVPDQFVNGFFGIQAGYELEKLAENFFFGVSGFFLGVGGIE